LWRLLPGADVRAVLAREGLELIVVGIPNAGDGRYADSTPYKGRRPGVSGGLGRAYLRWLTEVVKPEVDAAWPTRTEREATGIMGSSLGGFISLWAAVAHRPPSVSWVPCPTSHDEPVTKGELTRTGCRFAPGRRSRTAPVGGQGSPSG